MSGEDLRAAFVEAFPGYVAVRVEALGIETAQLSASIEAGRAWLDEQLGELLELEPAAQRRSPLEVFRMSLAFPTEALQQMGVAPPARDEAAKEALPGDTFDLAPASSQALGERAWKAHVAWGIAKARSVGGVVPVTGHARPVATNVAVVSVNEADRTAIGEVVAELGFGLVAWRNPAAISAGIAGTPPAMALVDLTHPAAGDALRAISSAGVPVVAYQADVDDFATDRARVLGAAEVLESRRLVERLPALLPRPI